MNLLMLILIALGIAVAVAVFRIAWKLTSKEVHHQMERHDVVDQEKSEEPGEAKESKESPGSSENP